MSTHISLYISHAPWICVCSHCSCTSFVLISFHTSTLCCDIQLSLKLNFLFISFLQRFFFSIKVAPLTNDLDVTLPKHVCVTVWDMLAQDSWFLIRDGDEFCMYHIVTCRDESTGRQEWRQPYPSPQCCAENLWGMEQRAGKSPGGTLTVHWGVGTH